MESTQTNLKELASPEKYIIEQLQSGNSKMLRDEMINWVGDDQEKFDGLFKILFKEDYKLVQRAAWPISYIVEQHPLLIRKHLGTVSGVLNDKNLKDVIKRNLLRLLQDFAIPKKYSGKIVHACFGFITDPLEKAAIKAFSITVLENISNQYPELREELKLVLQQSYEFETAAFRARARKILKKLA